MNDNHNLIDKDQPKQCSFDSQNEQGKSPNPSKSPSNDNLSVNAAVSMNQCNDLVTTTEQNNCDITLAMQHDNNNGKSMPGSSLNNAISVVNNFIMVMPPIMLFTSIPKVNQNLLRKQLHLSVMTSQRLLLTLLNTPIQIPSIRNLL